MATRKPNAPAEAAETISIKAANMKTGEIYIRGTAPLVVHKFSQKAINMIHDNQAAGSTARTKKNRAAKDFDAIFEGARHRALEGGWDGIPAPAFRAACIDACRLVGFKMTLAKLSIFFEADGYDDTEGTALVKIIGGAPRKLEKMVRLATGVCDISIRPQWLEWGAKLRVRYDADQFTASDVCNLINRAGMQCGVCEGRPSSKNSNGMGWGTFEISTKAEVEKLAKRGANK